MKNILLVLTFFFGFILIACGDKTKPNVGGATNDTIPEDAITFEYTRTKKIVLKGILNDSIPLNIMFDTGFGNVIFLTDSFRRKVGSTGNLRIGKFSKNLLINIMKRKDIPGMFVKNASITSWQYFKDKIIKISFQYKYIQVLDSNVITDGYESIKLNIIQGCLLTMPVQIHLQGKVLHENVVIDTGTDGVLFIDNSFVNKYALNLDSAERFTATTLNGFLNITTIKTDSVGVRKHFIHGKKISFGETKKSFINADGLLGNGFLEDFNIILDLRNIVLYLKPY